MNVPFSQPNINSLRQDIRTNTSNIIVSENALSQLDSEVVKKTGDQVISGVKTFNNDTRQGIFFGINSGVLTTVGVISGISQTTSNPMFVVVSVLSLAISDCVGEAYGMYLSKKAEHIKDTNNGPVVAMISMFLAKFLTVNFGVR